MPAKPDQGIWSLCSPGNGLTCFACCPPIRPKGYDHVQHRGPMTRLLSENTAAFRRGELPAGEITGYWCPGLGFLDSTGRTVGCLLHPARHEGSDLRGPTGYRDKCERESCPAARAFAALGQEQGRALLAACRGMDAFEYSSPRLNPVMLVLGFGPELAAAAAGLGAGREDMAVWPWLKLDPSLGWLLARMAARHGATVLNDGDLAGQALALAHRLGQRVDAGAPLEPGLMLAEMCDEWEARFWRNLSGRRAARPRELARWRELLEEALSAAR